MAKRKIIKIDEDKCNGCGECIPNCPEGALQIIDGKVRLISDLFCDGLGACIGHCPQGAIRIEEREAESYDERRVMSNVVKQGPNVIAAHLHHLKEHGQTEYYDTAVAYLKEQRIAVPGDPAMTPRSGGCHGAATQAHAGQPGQEEGQLRARAQQPGQAEGQLRARAQGCPGSRMMDFKRGPAGKTQGTTSAESQLRQWPVQLMLVPPYAPYLDNADILIAADCVPFAYAAFHAELLKGKALLVGCPKLDDTEVYREKLGQLLEHNRIKSITYAHMEVPCCFGLVGIIKDAIASSGKGVPFHDVTISIQGEKL